MEKSPQVRPSSRAHFSRRDALRGAASIATLAAATPAIGLLSTCALAQSAATLAAPIANPYAAPVNIGPSSRAMPAVGITPAAPGSPYLVPTAGGWSSTALMTAGNDVGSYRMTGVPDGLGAYDNGDGTLTLLMNHEIDAGAGSKRSHGGRGAFVSRWVIDIDTLAVSSGRDFIDGPAKLMLWRKGKWIPGDQVQPDPVMPQAAAAAPAAAAAAAAAGPALPSTAASAPGTPSGVQAPAPATAPAASAVPPPAPVPEPKPPQDLDRLCSADLAPISAFYNRASRKGYDGHIFLNGEEGDNKINRAFAWVVDERAAYELPAFNFGKGGDDDDPSPAWENLLANPATGNATVVMANSDGGPSTVCVYIGAKQSKGSAIEKAGLTNGRLYALRIDGAKEEDRDKNIGLAKARLGHGPSKRVGLAPVKARDERRGTAFHRPEDGAWDPRNPNVYYFATTDRENFASGDTAPHDGQDGQDPNQVGRSRLWAVTFDDVRRIRTDGRSTARIQMLLDGTEGGDMFDNITVDRNGIVYLCEDTGEARHDSKVWAYDTKTGTLTAIMVVDPDKFGSFSKGQQHRPPTPPFVDDKESSGILDVTDLFSKAKWFRPGSTALLVVVQAHFGYDGNDPVGLEINEGGQLLLLVKAP